MLIQPYRLEELQFAYCNRVFLRAYTHRRKPIQSLAHMNLDGLRALLEPYNIHVLELATTPTAVQAILSLLPSESASIAVSKVKGRISKWISSNIGSSEKSLGRGYFAATVGQSTTDVIDAYLEKQSEHHGYNNRARPPVWVQRIPQTQAVQSRLSTDHACTALRYHLVLATKFRQGVFTDEASRLLTEFWVGRADKVAIEKVSFLPDHVHVAVAIHPVVAPSELALALMNCSQELMWDRFPSLIIQAKIDRLWQPSAYIGSFGDLNSNAVASYMSNWMRSDEN
jgi:putative transposase